MSTLKAKFILNSKVVPIWLIFALFILVFAIAAQVGSGLFLSKIRASIHNNDLKPAARNPISTTPTASKPVVISPQQSPPPVLHQKPVISPLKRETPITKQPLQKVESLESKVLLENPWQNKEQAIVLDVAAQRFYCYQNGQVVYAGAMSSGTARDEQGKARDIYDFEYVVVKREEDAYSTQYATPMPYCLWLGNVPGNKAGRRSLAIHYGQLPGSPASHGCFRLGFSDAKWVFDWAKVGTPVYVINAKKP